MLQTAREITGARYAALGILNERAHRAGAVPDLGHRRADTQGDRRSAARTRRARRADRASQPLRLRRRGPAPRSYGFPAGHPVMHDFLGVPILIRGQAWGNLYLTEKQGGQFSERDEEAAVILAEWAAVAIDNARAYETSERRRREAREGGSQPRGDARRGRRDRGGDRARARARADRQARARAGRARGAS